MNTTYLMTVHESMAITCQGILTWAARNSPGLGVASCKVVIIPVTRTVYTLCWDCSPHCNMARPPTLRLLHPLTHWYPGGAYIKRRNIVLLVLGTMIAAFVMHALPFIADQTRQTMKRFNCSVRQATSTGTCICMRTRAGPLLLRNRRLLGVVCAGSSLGITEDCLRTVPSD